MVLPSAVWYQMVLPGAVWYQMVLLGVVQYQMTLPGVVWHRNCIAVAVADMIMGFLARERDQLTMCQLKGSVLGVPVFGVLGSVLGLPDARKY